MNLKFFKKEIVMKEMPIMIEDDCDEVNLNHSQGIAA